MINKEEKYFSTIVKEKIFTIEQNIIIHKCIIEELEIELLKYKKELEDYEKV